jgi:hypothetical protein
MKRFTLAALLRFNFSCLQKMEKYSYSAGQQRRYYFLQTASLYRPRYFLNGPHL